MADVDKALETQLSNIEKRTGKTLDELAATIRDSGLTKHGQIRDMLKETLGMGHGDANTLVHHVRRSHGAAGATGQSDASEADVLDAIYAGPKAALRPIHDAVMAAVTPFGDFEIAPKKNYVSLRRKKQFVTVGPTTRTRVDIGLNLQDAPEHERLRELPPGRMCSHEVRLTSPDEVDADLIGWIREAHGQAG